MVVGTLLTLVISDCRHRSTGANQKTVEITGNFKLPPELAGCRVYRMVPAGFGRDIYVVTRGGEPKAVSWEVREGKNGRRLETVLMEDAK